MLRGLRPSGFIFGAGEFARLMALLHAKALVFGDVSMRNVLWTPGDPVQIFVIDCDSMRKLGSRPVLPQAETPDWNDPHKPAVGPDLDTDRYKLALLVGRVLAGQPYIRPERNGLDLPSNLSPEVAARVTELWQRAGGPRRTRPGATQWLMTLDGHLHPGQDAASTQSLNQAATRADSVSEPVTSGNEGPSRVS